MKTTQTNTIKYAEYLRKSTDDKEKQVLSLGSQRDVLDRLKKAHNLVIVDVIEEKMSAKRPGRPGFAQLIALIKQGEINGIATWAPHRLSRNSVDIGEIINLFDTGALKEIVTESHTYRNNPMDIFMLGFHCLQAKFENDNKALDVKGGMKRCAKLHIYPGCPPLGYLPDKTGIKGARKREIDPIVFPIIRKMWDLMLLGTQTPYQIFSKAVNEWGLRTRKGMMPSKSMCYKIFHNPFYYGEFEFPKKSGDWYTGNHKPMITKSEFDRVQKMMRKPDNARPISNYFTFGGCVLHCSECGCAITGMAKTKRQKNGNVHHYTYYGCTKRRGICSQLPLTEGRLVADTEKILREIQMPKSIHDLMMDWVQREYDKGFADDAVRSVAHEKALSLIQKKIDGLVGMCADGLITHEEFQERRTQMDQEKNHVQQLIADTNQSVQRVPFTSDSLLTFVEQAADRFKKASPEGRRGILLSLGWNLCVKDKKLDLARENWIEPVKQIAKRVNQQVSTLEPFSSIDFKAEIEKFLNSSLMCSLLHDVMNLLVRNPDGKHFSIITEWKSEQQSPSS